MRKLRIVVADDHPLMRRGICDLLEAEPGWQVVEEATNGREAVEAVAKAKPDVLVIDLAMPELNGLTATREILRSFPKVEVVLLTMHNTDQAIREVLESGARGYVLKSDAEQDLVTAVKAVSDGKPFFTPNVAEVVLKGYLYRNKKTEVKDQLPELTTREREVVQLLAEGKGNKDVAVAMQVSVKTVEAHRSNINRKLSIRSTSDLVRYAVRNGIVAP
ncbi:DNA-binding NarL/FixJ family response regulator [Silvibacterium bohemicum]|uniref:DNA-binding NarL/FixJ family response regulator n=1 Tax=Silvibacterium bohemicum TaxID=1577686 RepID=A0A841JW19_9BACT|nr:response regulator transcription factor [Silvibacterium bohemicum]MBB6144745.1 DNA-binding NarL/FixJ family response regulator [Silvibacterium bohemicum]